MPQPAAGTADRDLRVDRLRGWFAILVMVGHAYDISTIYAAGKPYRVDMAGSILGPGRGFLGFLWVIGFIALSGYCIARSCDRQGDRFSLWRYVLLRVSRIYPLLIAAALLALLAETIMAGSPMRPQIWNTPGLPTLHFGRAMLGLSGFAQYGSLSPSYTITYELIYYAVWGIVWTCFARWRVVAMLAGVAGLLVLQYELVPGAAQLCAMVFLPWLLGAAGWLFRDEIAPLGRFVPEPVAWLMLLATSLSFAISANDWTGHPPLASTGIRAVLQFGLLGLAFVLLIASYTAKPQVIGPTAGFDRWLGDISYPLFIIHGPVIVFVGFLINWAQIEIRFSTHLIILCTCAIATAYLFAVTLERRVLELRKLLRSRTRYLPAPYVPERAVPAE